MLQEGVELLALQVGLGLGRARLVGREHGLLLDRVQVDGLLAFSNGRLEVGRAELGRLGVFDHEEGQHLGIVVLVARFLGNHSLLVGFAAVVVGVEARREGMPEAAARRIFLGRTARQKHETQKEKGKTFHC